MGVHYRRIFATEDDVLSVQHGNHLQLRHVLLHLTHCLGVFDDIIEMMYFSCDVSFYEVLVALELDRTVSADGLVVVARDGAVEGVHADVQNPVVQVLVFEDHLVHRSRLILCGEVLPGHEMLLVEVSLAHRHEVQ